MVDTSQPSMDASPLPLDTSPLRLAAARALPLNRRGRASATDASLGPRADRTLARWRAQRPFDQDGWFERRLAADALDPRLLRGLLTEPPDALVGRLGTPEPWLRHLAATFAYPPPAALAIPYQDAFATVAAPLLAAARDRLRQGIADLGPTPLGTPEEITAHLVPSLTASAHAMAVRTMIVELHAARLTGQLTGATPQDRYRDFLRRLADPAQALRLLAEYPVLARRLTVAAGQWTDTHLTLVRRLAADLPALSRTFAAGAPLGPLIEIRNGLGDAHRGGATVTALRFHGGTHLVYKPRPTDVDQHFQDLLHWLNPRLRLPLLEVAHLPGDGYGWTAHVTARPCRTHTELRAFYHRAGVLAALLYALEAVDCHAQNLIAVGDQPVLVDLEALFHPDLREPAKSLSPSERMARHDAAHSVLRSGLLPQRMWDEDGNGGADVSALGWDPARLPPRTVPQVAEDGTDRMHIVYRSMALKAAASRPVPPDQPLHLADFADDLDAGFTEAYTLLARDKPHVRRLLRAFATDHTRLLLRDTLEYRSLLAAAHHPDLLRDALDHDRHLDRLWALAAWEDSAEAFLVHERADLWNNDIPLFTVRPDSVDAHASTGALIPAVTDRPALDAALDKLHALGPHDLARQRQLLRLSVTTAAGASEPHHPRPPSPSARPHRPGPRRAPHPRPDRSRPGRRPPAAPGAPRTGRPGLDRPQLDPARPMGPSRTRPGPLQRHRRHHLLPPPPRPPHRRRGTPDRRPGRRRHPPPADLAPCRPAHRRPDRHRRHPLRPRPPDRPLPRHRTGRPRRHPRSPGGRHRGGRHLFRHHRRLRGHHRRTGSLGRGTPRRRRDRRPRTLRRPARGPGQAPAGRRDRLAASVAGRYGRTPPGRIRAWRLGHRLGAHPGGDPARRRAAAHSRTGRTGLRAHALRRGRRQLARCAPGRLTARAVLPRAVVPRSRGYRPGPRGTARPTGPPATAGRTHRGPGHGGPRRLRAQLLPVPRRPGQPGGAAAGGRNSAEHGAAAGRRDPGRPGGTGLGVRHAGRSAQPIPDGRRRRNRLRTAAPGRPRHHPSLLALHPPLPW
ncbi:type 2 lantipeptide synthetase LanM [Streptomyces sp. KM273126]|nr:type 2 lanthipeptide synthetase LanM [Streptomyces sp. KM273126]MBA2813868.1 type 2 lantipeptide synthetase LanM [Streptomyces sp. KM273126]